MARLARGLLQGRLRPPWLTLIFLMLCCCCAYLPRASATGRSLQQRRRPRTSPSPKKPPACSRLSKRTACGATALTFECSTSAAAAPPPACADSRSHACRVAAGPAPTECQGLQFSLAEATVAGAKAPAARLVAPAEASYYITAAVIARGAGGSCSFPAPPAQPTPAAGAKAVVFRAPGTAVGAVDICVCVPTTITFEPVGGADGRVTGEGNPTALLKAPACAPGKSAQRTVPLPRARAVDDCGREHAVAIETSVPGVPRGNNGGSIDLGAVPCGVHTVTYSAALPAGDLLAVKDFTFEVQCAADDAEPCI